MRKIALFLIAASLAALASCQKDPVPSAAENAAPAVLHATFESPATTRAGFDYDAAGKTYYHFWEVGDRLLWVDRYAYTPGDQVSWLNRYDCTGADGTFARDSHFFLTDDYRGTQSYNGDTEHSYAVYPYSVSCVAALETFLGNPSNTQGAWYEDWGYESLVLSSLNSLYINLPATETFAPSANTLGYGNVALAKVDDDFTDVDFRTCMGWLKLQLTGASAVKKVSVRGHVIDEDHPLVLSGRGYIEQINSDAPYVRLDTDDAWDFEDWQFTKTVEIASPYLTLDPETPTPVYLALPPTNFANGMTVTVTFANDVVKTISTNAAVVIKRNVVTPMKNRDVILDATLDEGMAFNAAIKTLAAGTAKTYGSSDNLIKGIVMETLSATTTGTVVSSADSEEKVYANFNSGTGVLTLSTPAGSIHANANSSYLFASLNGLTALDLSGLMTDKVTKMDHMFYYCEGLKTLTFGEGFVTSLVTDFSSMFYSCHNLTALDVSGFDTSRATRMERMFYWCAQLQELSVSGFDLSRVTDMSEMFSRCYFLTTIDLSGKSAPLVTNMSSMFSQSLRVTTIKLPATTDVLKDVSYMFDGCEALTTLDATAFEAKPTTIQAMFRNCKVLAQLTFVPGFDTSTCGNYRELFKGDTALWTVRFPGLIIGSGCFNLNDPYNFYYWFYEALASVSSKSTYCLIYVQPRSATGSGSWKNAFDGYYNYTGKPTITEVSSMQQGYHVGTVYFIANMTI